MSLVEHIMHACRRSNRPLSVEQRDELQTVADVDPAAAVELARSRGWIGGNEMADPWLTRDVALTRGITGEETDASSKGKVGGTTDRSEQAAVQGEEAEALGDFARTIEYRHGDTGTLVSPEDYDFALAASLEPPSTFGRYYPLRFLARGGLGEVVVAQDGELNREVALKSIRPQFARSLESRRRFVVEGEVTGRLEHPGIVPVYGMGTTADGSPYYAMRLIRGASLTDHIRLWHANRSRLARRDDLRLHKLLRQFISVCYTLEYAHSRGVLHRDIKPDNIMLGPYGEALVVDWGLAKLFDPKDRASVRSQNGDATVEEDDDADSAMPHPLKLASQQSDSETLGGSVAGTLGYMSPEQAQGFNNRLTPASDVFALGAVLFEILTGEPLRKPKNLQEGIAAAIRCQPRSPRSILPRVPRSLDAICLKATAKDLATRYSQASDLAADLEAYLADEPVNALPESLLSRSWRWVRKHRGVVRTAAAAGLITLVGAIMFAVVVSRKNSEIAQRNNEVVQQRDEARQNLTLAQSAVQDYLAALSRDGRLKSAGLDRLRLELAKEAQPYYKTFLEKAADSREVLRAQAELLSQLAVIASTAGSLEEAYQYCLQNAVLLRQLRRLEPRDPQIALALARNEIRLADIESRRGQFDAAKAKLAGVLELATEPLLKRWQPEERNVEAANRQMETTVFANLNPLELQVVARQLLGFIAQSQGDLAEAFDQYQRAVTTVTQADLSTPWVYPVQLDIATVQRLRGQYSDASDTIETVRQEFSIDDYPELDQIDAELFLIEVTMEAADVHMAAGRPWEAYQLLEAAVVDCENLVERHPENSSVRLRRAYAENNLILAGEQIGGAAASKGGEDRGQEQLELARRQLDDQQSIDANSFRLRINQASMALNGSNYHYSRQDYVAAEAHARSAIAIAAAVNKEHPQVWEAVSKRLWGLLHLADAVSWQGRTAEAIAAVETAIDEAVANMDDRPEVVEFLHIAGDGLWRRYQLSHTVDAAHPYVDRRIALLERLRTAERPQPWTARYLSFCHENLAELAVRAGNKPQAIERIKAAIEFNEVAIESAPREPGYRVRQLTLLRWARRLSNEIGESSQSDPLLAAAFEAIKPIESRWLPTDVLSSAAEHFERLAEDAVGTGRDGEAAEHFDTAIAMRQALFERGEGASHLLTQAHMLASKAEVMAAAGQDSETAELLDKAESLVEQYRKLSRSRAADRSMAELAATRGRLRFAAGDYRGAVAHFDRAAVLAAGDAMRRSRLWRAHAAAKTGATLSVLEDVQGIDRWDALADDSLYAAAAALALGAWNLTSEDRFDELEDQMRPGMTDKSLKLLQRLSERPGGERWLIRAKEDDDFRLVRDKPEFLQLIP